eukprot:575012-Amphidinium_carterae.1
MTAFELVRRASRVTEAMGEGDMKQVDKLVECSKWLMKHRITDLLENHPGASTLYQYSCDCTPLRTREYYSTNSTGNRARGSASMTYEYM